MNSLKGKEEEERQRGKRGRKMRGEGEGGELRKRGNIETTPFTDQTSTKYAGYHMEAYRGADPPSKKTVQEH